MPTSYSTRGHIGNTIRAPMDKHVYIQDIAAHDGHTHVAFVATLRPDREIDVLSEGNFIASVANPDPTAWGLTELPPLQDELFPEYEVHVTIPTPFPPSIQQRFGGRRYINLEPELLDYPGAELIFITTKEPARELVDERDAVLPEVLERLVVTTTR